MQAIDVIKVLAPSAIAFFAGIAITPFVTSFLYKHKMWKKKAKEFTTDGRPATIFNELHGEREVSTPKMGGSIIWLSAFLTIAILWLISNIFPSDISEKLSFLSRGQTWLPLFTLLVGAVIGLVDDYFDVRGSAKPGHPGGLSYKHRLGTVFVVSLIGAWWFFSKLEISSVIIPFAGTFDIGILFIPFFILVMLGLYSGGVIDGIDGLAGGVLASSFSAYGIIAFTQSQIDLAAFCFVIVGGILAFLWFNIPPARFYMSETGTMALTTTLAVVAFLTEHVLLLLVIAFPLVISALSSALQLLSKRLRNGKKIFKIAPLHHHFEAMGWPPYKVTMRYWVISVIFSFLGVIIALIG